MQRHTLYTNKNIEFYTNKNIEFLYSAGVTRHVHLTISDFPFYEKDWSFDS